MGLFDKLRARSADVKQDKEIAVQPAGDATVPSVISKAVAEREYRLGKATRVPLTDAVLTGSALAQLAPALKSILSGGQVGDGALVRVSFPPEVKGTLATDKMGKLLGMIKNDKGKIAGQARLIAVDPATIAAQAAMAAALMEINQKLDNIQETQQKILSFLEQDKQAEQKGNLNVLTDILEGYKHNCDSPQYLQNHHMKVLDIKQTAEKNIVFYQEQIADAIKKLPAIHLNQKSKTAISDLGKLFANYRMASYLFSFASFLEVMLLGNFRQAYLDQVAEKVKEYNRNYQSQFAECRDMIKKFSAQSIETKVLTGIGNASKALGKLIASAPVLAQGPVDEWLEQGGNKLIQETGHMTENTVALFHTEGKTGGEVFESSIRSVASICNQTTDVLFDNDALYLVPAQQPTD